MGPQRRLGEARVRAQAGADTWRGALALLPDSTEHDEGTPLDRDDAASRIDLGPGLGLRFGGRELVRPGTAERDGRKREEDRVVPGVEEDQEGVVDHRRTLLGLGGDLASVQEDAERERVVVAPVA